MNGKAGGEACLAEIDPIRPTLAAAHRTSLDNPDAGWKYPAHVIHPSGCDPAALYRVKSLTAIGISRSRATPKTNRPRSITRVES